MLRDAVCSPDGAAVPGIAPVLITAGPVSDAEMSQTQIRDLKERFL